MDKSFISLKFLYIGKFEHKSITSFLTSFSIFELSFGLSERPFIVFVIKSPTFLNSLAPNPLVVASLCT